MKDKWMTLEEFIAEKLEVCDVWIACDGFVEIAVHTFGVFMRVGETRTTYFRLENITHVQIIEVPEMPKEDV